MSLGVYFNIIYTSNRTYISFCKLMSFSFFFNLVVITEREPFVTTPHDCKKTCKHIRFVEISR